MTKSVIKMWSKVICCAAPDLLNWWVCLWVKLPPAGHHGVCLVEPPFVVEPTAARAPAPGSPTSTEWSSSAPRPSAPPYPAHLDDTPPWPPITDGTQLPYDVSSTSSAWWLMLLYFCLAGSSLQAGAGSGQEQDFSKEKMDFQRNMTVSQTSTVESTHHQQSLTD